MRHFKQRNSIYNMTDDVNIACLDKYTAMKKTLINETLSRGGELVYAHLSVKRWGISQFATFITISLFNSHQNLQQLNHCCSYNNTNILFKQVQGGYHECLEQPAHVLIVFWGKNLQVGVVDAGVRLAVGADVLVDGVGLALQHPHAPYVEPVLAPITADVESVTQTPKAVRQYIFKRILWLFYCPEHVKDRFCQVGRLLELRIYRYRSLLIHV